MIVRRIGVEFVKKAERETSTGPDQQDNERQGPQSGPEHASLRDHHRERPVSFRRMLLILNGGRAQNQTTPRADFQPWSSASSAPTTWVLAGGMAPAVEQCSCG